MMWYDSNWWSNYLASNSRGFPITTFDRRLEHVCASLFHVISAPQGPHQYFSVSQSVVDAQIAKGCPTYEGNIVWSHCTPHSWLLRAVYLPYRCLWGSYPAGLLKEYKKRKTSGCISQLEIALWRNVIKWDKGGVTGSQMGQYEILYTWKAHRDGHGWIKWKTTAK